MNRYVSEIFGYPPSNKDKNAKNVRSKFLCPFYSGFPNGQCDPVNKKSNLTDDDGTPLIKHQSGACSVMHNHRGTSTVAPIIICPYRFYEKDSSGKIIVLEYIKNKFFSGKNMVFVPEIGLGVFGRADGMLCEIVSNNNLLTIKDYAHIEFQADATTATRELVQCVKDFFDGEDVSQNNYTYGLNSKASIKGSSLQMIDKGYLFRHFGKKSIWIIENSLFEVLCSVYNVQMKDITKSNPNADENLIFVVVKLVHNSKIDSYEIKVDKCYCTSAGALQNAISNKAPIRESVIIDSVLAKISSKVFYKL